MHSIEKRKRYNEYDSPWPSIFAEVSSADLQLFILSSHHRKDNQFFSENKIIFATQALFRIKKKYY